MKSSSKLFAMLLCVVGVARAGDGKPDEVAINKLPAYDISEFNRVYWRWKRCMNRWEQERGASDSKKQLEVCGAEPMPPKPMAQPSQ
ncbi:MAG: hypothetical protein QM808_18215 [Steroidobacteraceae bacterium]